MADQTRSYEIRVSAVLDRSTAAAAGDFVQQFTRAHRASGRSQVTEAERAQRNVNAIRDRYFAQQQRQEEQTAKRAASQSEQAAKRQATSQEQAQRYVSRIRDRYFADQQRQEDRALADKERAAVRSAERTARAEVRASAKALEERKAQVRQIAGDSISNAAAIANKALGVGKEIAGGMGVNFSVGSGIAKSVQLEKMAVGIVNAGNRGGGDPAARDAEAKRLQASAREVGNKYAFDPTAMLSGYAQFQAKTGDTDTASAGMERFASLAKAFNVELNDMISAAGEISSKLEDSFTPGEKRAAKTYEILKKLTAQGQEGAIEIADLAKETARIGGGAGFFKGDIGDTIAKLGSLAQLARQTGGANSAADSARSVAAFVTTLKTPARRKAFDANGVEYKDKDGSFLDPFTIIKNALRATGGNTEKMNEMFKSSLGTKPVDALAKAYTRGGGGEGGMAEVEKLFAKFSGTISEDTVKENAARAMNTTESKAIIFQNKLDAIAASLAERVLPAFERLAPTVEKVMTAFADVVSWSANNPGQAITLAIIGSIGKATLGPMIAKAITDKIAGGMGGAGQAFDPERKVMGMQAGTAGSIAGQAMMIGTIAVTTFTVGSMIVDKLVDTAAQAETGTMNDDLKAMETDTLLKILAKGKGGPEEAKKVQENMAQLQNRIEAAKDEKGQMIGGTFGAMLRAGENYVTGGPGMQQMEQAQNDIPQLAALEAQLAAQKAAFADIASKTLTIKGTVEVSNMQPGMGSSSGGREGVPDHS